MGISGLLWTCSGRVRIPSVPNSTQLITAKNIVAITMMGTRAENTFIIPEIPSRATTPIRNTNTADVI